MKKIGITIILLALIIGNIHCGGGGSASSKNTSLVTITVGDTTKTASIQIEPETFFTKVATFFKNLKQTPALASIPSNVHKILFMVAGPEMSTMTKEVLVLGQTQIKESFSVQNGKNRYFLVEAKDIAGKVLYSGEASADLDGKPVHLFIIMKALDTTPPSVISTDPAANETGVATTSPVLTTFSETIDPATFNSTTFSLTGAGLSVGGTFSVNGAVATFSPFSPLAYSTLYTATISAGVKDTFGNMMNTDYAWTFTTAAAPDTTPPTITGVSPAIDAKDVAVTSAITAAFSELIDVSTINSSTFLLKDKNGSMVPGVVTYSGLTATFSPSAALEHNMTYTAVVTTGVRDLVGNTLAADYLWSFTTAQIADTTPPVFEGLVSATAASSTSIDLSWNAASDAISPASKIVYLIYAATTPGGQNFASPLVAVTGATSTTLSGLTPNTTYYCVVRAQDEAGNRELNVIEKSATTLPTLPPVPVPDTTPPVFSGLSAATPLSPTDIQLTWNAATDNITPQAQIRYLIYMANISGAYIDLYPHAIATGGVSYTVSNLTPGTLYYFRVWAVDAAGNLASNSVEKSATTPLSGIDLEPKNAAIGISPTYTISAEIYNNGSSNAFNINVFIESCDSYNCECNPVDLTTIPANSFIVVAVDPYFIPPTSYRIIVDPGYSINESNETNNCTDSSSGGWCASVWPVECNPFAP